MTAPRHPETIQVGNKAVQQWMDPEVQGIVKEIQEIDPNLVLCRNEQGDAMVLWAGPQGWVTWCHMRNPTKMDLLRLPQRLRENDRTAPHNQGRNLELDLIAGQERHQEKIDQDAKDKLEDVWERLHFGLRKDLGHIKRVL